MANALVFGSPNALVNRLADGLSDVLKVPERYQRSFEDHDQPGVEICTNAAAFAREAPIIAFADGHTKERRVPDRERASALATLAEAAAMGRNVAIIASKTEAQHWIRHIRDERLPGARPMRRVYILGESGSGKTTLAKLLAPALGLPFVSIDEEYWHGDSRPDGREARRQRVAEIAAGENWVVEGAYRGPVRTLSACADIIVHLDLPAQENRKRREARGATPGQSMKERIITAAFRKSYSFVYGPRLSKDLAAAAHLAPVFYVRNEAEREALTAGLLRGAAAAATFAKQAP